MANPNIARTLVLLICTIFVSPHLRCLGQKTGTQSCDSSTVDDLDPGMAKRAKAFLARLKVAIGSDNRQQVAAMLAYPLRVFEGNNKKNIEGRSEFLADYGHLITPEVKKAVLAQTPDCLFANYQGVMIGNGVIWFQEQSNGSFRIVTINLSKAATK